MDAFGGDKKDKEAVLAEVILPTAKNNGFDLTLDELKAYQPENGELDDEQLEVAGGVMLPEDWGNEESIKSEYNYRYRHMLGIYEDYQTKGCLTDNASNKPDITLPIQERPIGGLGLHMVRKMMDYIDYKYEDARNVFTIGKKDHSQG